MCLYNDKSNVKEFLRKNKNKMYVTVYKEVTKYDAGPVMSNFKYKLGWNGGNAKARKPVFKDVPLAKGIHVYLSSHNKKKYDSSFKLLKCSALVEDLIGVGGDNDRAIFNRIFISSLKGKRLESNDNYIW